MHAALAAGATVTTCMPSTEPVMTPAAHGGLVGGEHGLAGVLWSEALAIVGARGGRTDGHRGDHQAALDGLVLACGAGRARPEMSMMSVA